VSTVERDSRNLIPAAKAWPGGTGPPIPGSSDHLAAIAERRPTRAEPSRYCFSRIAITRSVVVALAVGAGLRMHEVLSGTGEDRPASGEEQNLSRFGI